VGDHGFHRFVSRLRPASLIRSHGGSVGYRQLCVNPMNRIFWSAFSPGKTLLLPARLLAAGSRPLGQVLLADRPGGQIVAGSLGGRCRNEPDTLADSTCAGQPRQ
ncbi:MAG: hypothetical protein ACK55Z_38005, partial [bacterium]